MQPLVGAYYFGIFSKQAPYLAQVKLVYGRDGDWWGGVRDFYAKTGRPYRQWSSGSYDHLKPLIGYYDQSEVKTLETHIDQAAGGGLKFFNFYFYWSQTRKVDNISAGLRSFLQAKNRDRLKFQLSLFAHPWDADLAIPVSQFQVFAEFVAKNYFTQSNYLTINNRPVFTIGDGHGIGSGSPEDVDLLIGMIRMATKKWAPSRSDLIVLLGPGGLDNWPAVKDIQGTQTHVPNHGDLQGLRPLIGKSYSDWIKGVLPFFNLVTSSKRLPLAPSFASNFDERPRQDIMIADAKQIRFFTDATLLNFEKGFEQVVKYSLAQPDSISKLITIYAWNEWHEGGIIEPDVKNKDAYLKSISKILRNNGVKP